MTIVNLGEDVDQSFTCRILLGGMVLGEETVPGLKKVKPTRSRSSELWKET